MKKTLLAFSILAASTGVHAIENGTPISATDFPSLVEMDCTGTLIGGKWVLTAWHCTWADTGGLRPVNLVGAETNTDGSQSYTQVDAIDENRFNGTASDISLWELARSPEVDKVLFLSNTPIERDLTSEFSIYGFGQTNQKLNSATYQIDNYILDDEELLYLGNDFKNGTIAPGDSGGPILLDNKIVAITNGIGPGEPPVGTPGDNYHSAIATRLSYSQDWILETVNAWHHPTIGTVDAGKSTTIEAQSLHMGAVSDDASASGDIEIDVANSSCLNGLIQPFDICTYTVTSENGYEGTLTLADGQTVVFNKGKSKPVTPPTPTPDEGGSSGGSMGFLSLLALFGFGLLRKGQSRHG
ncbi:hypothetical protein TUM4438_40430 [Shewanella sairae]|uniref:Peptidase S1 domain-containing protein n=1 Tax=Shewanella sairae TaxID=190310 RepID=A0ABQ4PQV1_9GAMM|nr:trypsin-like serine protease [Shewanella sairae]MCL1132247.1 S1 family peptidase [Shewanella sairae]GIU51298.1 hypothetical protein TUM4438_40430 [Shewanella sairae]